MILYEILRFSMYGYEFICTKTTFKAIIVMIKDISNSKTNIMYLIKFSVKSYLGYRDISQNINEAIPVTYRLTDRVTN